MNGKGDSPARKRRGCRRRLLIWLLLPLLGAAVVVWWQRDLPRRTVERELAGRLGARVHLGSLKVRGSSSFELVNLEVSEVASLPWLASLRVKRVEVEGRVGEILDGRIALLRLSGAEARLAPSTREPEAEPPASGVRIERLLLEDGRIGVEAGERAEFAVQAVLREVGSGAEGVLRVASSGFPIAPLLALRGISAPANPIRLSGFEAEASLAAAGRELTLEARSASTRIAGAAGAIDLPGAALRATALRDKAAGIVRIDAQPVLPAVGSSTLWVEIDAEDGALLRGEAELSGIALAEALPLLPLSFPTQQLRLEGTADLKVHVPEPGLVAYGLDARVDSAELRRGEQSIAVRRATLRLEGAFAPRDGYRGETVLRLSAARARISGADLDVASQDLTAGGTGKTAGGAAPLEIDAKLRAGTLAGTVSGRGLPHEAAPLELEVRGTVAELRSPRFEGELSLRGPVLGELRASGSMARNNPAIEVELDWVWSGARAERLAESIDGLDRSISVRGLLGGRGRLRGELPWPRVEGEFHADGLSVAISGGAGSELREGRAAAGFAWSPLEPELLLSSLELDGLLHVKRLEPVRVRIDGSGSFSPRQGLARLREATLELDGLARLRLDGAWNAESDPPVLARVGLDETDLAALRSRLKPLTGDPLPGYSLTGTLRSALRVGWRPGGAWDCTGEVLVGGPGLSSEDGSRVLQAMDTTLTVAAESAGPGAGASLDISAPLEGFLLLWGTLFGDWSERTGKVGLRAELPPEGGPGEGTPLWTARLLLDLDDGPRLRAGLADSGNEAIEYELHAEIADLAPVFERWARAPLKDSLAVMEGMEAGGAAAVEARGRLSPVSRTLEGRIDLRNASMETGGGGVSVRRLFLDLPWNLRWEADSDGRFAQVKTEPLEGSLAFGRLSFGDIRFEETSSDLVVEGDSVALRQKLSMPFLDGLLGLERPTLVDALQPARRVESGVRISGASLGELTRALDVVPLEGTVDGHFPRVTLSATALRVEGDGEFALLGGRVVVREISGEEVLSRFPKIVFSAEFEEIDLQQLTHTFDFGEMKGTLEGWIRNCELFRWVPVRFRARLETVERKGVPQTLNVKAINNIAILGTGGRVSVFDRGIHKFLDRYTYSRLGVEMALAQDSFLLRGLESRGERELFLKGRLPFRIDVVNAQPGKAVSFRTMLDRLSTLDFSASTTAPP